MNIKKRVSDSIIIEDIAKVNLGAYPTPIDAAGDLLIKRDDVSGFGKGGIKTRKLETGFGHILSKGFTDIVVIVPSISNLRHDLELLAKNNNIDFHFIIVNAPPVEDIKKLVVSSGSNCHYTFIGSSSIVVAFRSVLKYLTLLVTRKKVGFCLPGMAHPSSIIGASKGLFELHNQLQERGYGGNARVFISGCSGSSAAGLILASKVLKLANVANIKIEVVQVFPMPLKYWIWLQLLWTKIKYGLSAYVAPSEILIHIKHLELGYGKSNPVLDAICKDVLAEYKINLDPIYGARTWSVMQDLKDYQAKNKIVFWHCGFTSDWKVYQ